MTVTYARNDMVRLGPLIDEIHSVNPFIGKDLVAKSILQVILEGPSRLFNNPDAQGEDMLPLQVDGQGGEIFSQNRISFIDRLWSHKVIETFLRLRLTEAVCSTIRTAVGKDEAIAAQGDAGLAALRNAWPELWDPASSENDKPSAQTDAKCHPMPKEDGGAEAASRQTHVADRIAGSISRWLRATVFANQHDDDKLENDCTPQSERPSRFDVERLLDFFNFVAVPAHWAAALFTATGFAVPPSLVELGAASMAHAAPNRTAGRKEGSNEKPMIMDKCLELAKAGKIDHSMSYRDMARMVMAELGGAVSLHLTSVARYCSVTWKDFEKKTQRKPLKSLKGKPRN